MKEIKYKINHEIKNQEIRLVFDQENKIISLSDALEIAKNRNLDLICINDKVDPVICKIDNYKKLKFGIHL